MKFLNIFCGCELNVVSLSLFFLITYCLAIGDYYLIPYVVILAGKPEEVKRLPGGKIKKKACFGILKCNFHLMLYVHDDNYNHLIDTIRCGFFFSGQARGYN